MAVLNHHVIYSYFTVVARRFLLPALLFFFLKKFANCFASYQNLDNFFLWMKLWQNFGIILWLRTSNARSDWLRILYPLFQISKCFSSIPSQNFSTLIKFIEKYIYQNLWHKGCIIKSTVKYVFISYLFGIIIDTNIFSINMVNVSVWLRINKLKHFIVWNRSMGVENKQIPPLWVSSMFSSWLCMSPLLQNLHYYVYRTARSYWSTKPE